MIKILTVKIPLIIIMIINAVSVKKHGDFYYNIKKKKVTERHACGGMLMGLLIGALPAAIEQCSLINSACICMLAGTMIGINIEKQKPEDDDE